jgi:hypothetical protein
MTYQYNLSPPLKALLEFTESALDTEILLSRRMDVPPHGLLVDDYTFATGKNIIAFPGSTLGMLKDFIIAKNCVHLLFRGMAAKKGQYRVLSFTQESAIRGADQIYLDTLKDENTRNMEIWRKKQLIFYLYMLFHETLSNLPWSVLANILIAKKYPMMRNAQIYSLVKESMRDMHDLVPAKEFLPQRYFVMHNGLYYGRDMILAYFLSENKLNPVINIPELQKFRNLDVKEMMSVRWSRSPWYHTKIVGDAMSNVLKLSLTVDFERPFDDELFSDLYRQGEEIANRWMVMMAMPNWYLWEPPEHLREAQKQKDLIEKATQAHVFGDEG